MSIAKEIVDAIEEMWLDGKTDMEMILILADRGHHVTKGSIIGLRHRRGWEVNTVKVNASMLLKPRLLNTRLLNTIKARAPGARGVDLATFLGPEPVVEEPMVAEPVVERSGLPTLFDLRFNECHWPVGRDGALTTYCGAKAEEGCDYCGPHYREGHRPLPKRGRL